MPPITPNLFTDETPARLVGGKHLTTGKIVFPCPQQEGYEPFPLARRGKIWSYTIQRFRPKSPPYCGPEDFEPWPVAYVELPGEVIIETRLTDVALDAITIGMDVELTQIPLNRAAENPMMIHAFRPIGSGK